LAVSLSNSVEAADIAIKMPVKAPASVPSYDWNGLYFGGHVGYSRGSAQVALGEPDPTSFRKSFGSLSGGIQAGYNRVLPSRLLLGIEADLSVLNALSGSRGRWDALFKRRASSTRPTGSCISTPAGRPVPERKSRSRRAGRSGWNISIGISDRPTSCSRRARRPDRRTTSTPPAWD
jgi:opacity protein-like surface antigen